MVWTRARRKGSVGRRGERLPLLPAAVLSSSTRNQRPRNGLDPGKKEEKRRKKWRKAATSTSTALSLSTRILHPHFGLDPCKKKKKRRKTRRKAATSTRAALRPALIPHDDPSQPPPLPHLQPRELRVPPWGTQRLPASPELGLPSLR